jgi:hypothetical protein
MAVQWADAVRNAMLDAWETAIGTSALLRIYSGTPPADESTALSGNTLLKEFAMASDWAAAAATGSKGLNNLPLSGAAAATGVASFYRIYNSGGTTCYEQGTVGTSGTDMIIDNTSINSGQTVNVTAFSKTAPG